MRTRLVATLGAAAALVASGLVVAVASPAWAAGSCTQTALAAKAVSSQGVIAAEIPASTQNADGLTCSLSQGNSGAAVRHLQQTLKDCYGASITADGQFGPATKAALVSAQAAEGISADGQYGPQTRGALKWKTYGDTLCGRLYSPLTYLGAPTGDPALGNAIVARAQVELADTSRNFEWSSNPSNDHGSTNCTFYAGAEGASWPLCRPGTTWRGGSSAGDSTYAWCALFVRYVWRNSGASISYTDGYASSFRTQGQNFGTYHTRASGYTPQPGDAVMFDWESDGVIDHIGIVTSVSGSTIYTIEGNSNNATRANTHGRSDASVVGYTTPRAA